MSTLTRDAGIILRTIRHGETSSIITVFTRRHGKVGLIAKGARRQIKKGCPLALELFTEAEFVYYHKPSRDLQLLKELSLQHAHLGIRDSLSGMTLGSAILELLLRCLHEEDPHDDLYDATQEALAALDAQQGVCLPLLWKFELILFQALGFNLQIRQCAVTGKAFTPPFTGPIRFRYRDGIFISPDASCTDGTDGALSADSFAILARLMDAGYPFAGRLIVKEKTEQEISRFLNQYLESHLPVSGRLRSLEALRWTRKANQ
jgi:DNA repair protein RecO (recombination protein O)